MATCAIETGMLMWKKACGAESAGACCRCGLAVCGKHAGDKDGDSVICFACLEKFAEGGAVGRWDVKDTRRGAAAPPGADTSPQTDAAFNARLQHEFPHLEPVIENLAWRDFGESRIAVGRLAITVHRKIPDSTMTSRFRSAQAGAALSSDALRFPPFELRPENLGSKLAVMAAQLLLRTGNFGTVDFAAQREFTRRYRVHSPDAEHTRWLFNDRVLAQLASREGLSMSAANGSLLLYRAETELAGEQLEAFFKDAVEVLRAFEAAAGRPSSFSAAAPAPTTRG